MSVTISSGLGDDGDGCFTDCRLEGGSLTDCSWACGLQGLGDFGLTQQEIQKAKYDAAVAAHAKIIPVNPNAPTGPLPPPGSEIYAFMNQPGGTAVAPAADEPYYAAGATDLNLPPLVRAALAQKAGIPWKTVGIVAGVVAVGGLAVWMMVKTSRGFRRPAMAGLGRPWWRRKNFRLAGLAGHRRRRRR